MEILLTGATGYIGKAVLARLLSEGHTVTAVVRSESSADEVRSAGATALHGDLSDAEWLREQLEASDGAIHTAAGGDAGDEAMNKAVLDAVEAVYAGTARRYVHTGGVWTYGCGDAITEETPSDPPGITAWRVPLEQRILGSEVSAAVVQPGIVYGRGTGIPAALLGGPRQDGALVLIGSGDQHWTTVHVDDLAELYVTVLTSEVTGPVIGAGGDNPTVAELGAAAGDAVPGSDEEAADRLGPAFAEALLLDQQASGAKARDLGWTPTRPTLVDLLAKGYPEDE